MYSKLLLSPLDIRASADRSGGRTPSALHGLRVRRQPRLLLRLPWLLRLLRLLKPAVLQWLQWIRVLPGHLQLWIWILLIS